MFQHGYRLDSDLCTHPSIIYQEQEAPNTSIVSLLPPSAKTEGHKLLHLLDFKTRNVHAADDVGEKRNHVIIAHCHVGNDFLQGDLLYRMILILLSTAVQLEA